MLLLFTLLVTGAGVAYVIRLAHLDAKAHHPCKSLASRRSIIASTRLTGYGVGRSYYYK